MEVDMGDVYKFKNSINNEQEPNNFVTLLINLFKTQSYKHKSEFLSGMVQLTNIIEKNLKNLDSESIKQLIDLGIISDDKGE